MRFFFKPKKPAQEAVILTHEEEELLRILDIDSELGLAIKSKTNNRIEKLYEVQEFDDYADDPKLRGIKSIVDPKVTMSSLYEGVKELQSISTFKDYRILSWETLGVTRTTL